MTTEKSAEKKKMRRTALIVCGLSSFLTPFMGSSINVAIPEIGREFSMTAVSLGWVVTAYHLAALINYSATFTIGFLLSLYLQYIKGLPPHQAGVILIAQPLVQALTSPFAGRLSDRVEPRIIASAGMAVTSAGLLLLSFLKSGSQLIWAVGILAWLGLGFGLFSSPNTNAVMGSVERKCFGTASATLGTMRLSGQMFGAGITLMIFALFLGESPITPKLFPRFLASLRTAFMLYAGVCFLGIFVSLARGTRNREEVS